VSTQVDERPDTRTDDGSGDDGPEVSHYARKEEIADAYIFGKAIQALCGKIFVPTRDPERYPLCSICKEIAESLWGES